MSSAAGMWRTHHYLKKTVITPRCRIFINTAFLNILTGCTNIVS